MDELLADDDLHTEWLGRVDYDVAVLRMLTQAQARRGGQVPDTLLLCEHPPTITLGRRANESELLLPVEALQARGVCVVRTDRGGLATYHGPGQLVGYPIVWVGRAADAGARLARACGEVLIELARACGVQARWRDDAPGAWTDAGKLGAVGLRIEDGVSRHGFAFNVSVDLEPFTWLVPCGMRGAQATSVLKETGRAVNVVELAPIAAERFTARWRATRPDPRG